MRFKLTKIQKKWTESPRYGKKSNLWQYGIILLFLRQQNRKDEKMTAMELNAEIWRNMAAIADDETLMKQLAKYLKKLVAKKEDPTLMTKEEFF